jgi:hypothetical protein
MAKGYGVAVMDAGPGGCVAAIRAWPLGLADPRSSRSVRARGLPQRGMHPVRGRYAQLVTVCPFGAIRDAAGPVRAISGSSGPGFFCLRAGRWPS